MKPNNRQTKKDLRNTIVYLSDQLQKMSTLYHNTLILSPARRYTPIVSLQVHSTADPGDTLSVKFATRLPAGLYWICEELK